MSPNTTDHPNVLVFPPLLYSGTLVVSLLLHWFKPWGLPHMLPVRIVGIGLIAAGLTLGVWGQRTLRRAGTNVNPREPTLAIVSDGPYRFTRNPLYVALIGLYLGITLAVGTVWPLVFLIPVLLITHYGIIKREERYLAGKFGEPYGAYMARVRRWI
jgi:protein-S-isoprenylcysteine O-methyltransferase Ste14